jgi:hypothetical protein
MSSSKSPTEKISVFLPYINSAIYAGKNRKIVFREHLDCPFLQTPRAVIPVEKNDEIPLQAQKQNKMPRLITTNHVKTDSGKMATKKRPCFQTKQTNLDTLLFCT